MDELEFNDSIDQKFPYQDDGKCRELIKEAKGISPNASFMVLHEICRPPDSVTVPKAKLLELHSRWKSVNPDRLATAVAMMAEAILKEEPVPEENGIELMEIIRNVKDQYNALTIIYFACYAGGSEVQDLYEEILSEWDPNR